MSDGIHVKFRDYDVFKLLICGPGASGKTSLCKKITSNTFSANYNPTVGVEFHTYKIKAKSGHSIVLFYDLAGQKRFSILRKLLFPGTTAVGIVFDLSDKNSFREVATWIRDIRKISSDIEVTIIGNKADKKRDVNREDAERIAKKLGCYYIETSALTGEGVANMMKTLVSSAIKYCREHKKLMAYGEINSKGLVGS